MSDHTPAAASSDPAGLSAGRPIQNPKGTRDWYPQDAVRRRFLTESMRRASVLHGFEEVDGPTFEHLDLYTVKSGEGIVSELFSFQRSGGEDTYALRPEFTPTLARMYAARAGSMPRPTKWFSVGPYFRAERPQRGRLREFVQWNVDVLGLEPHDEADAAAARRARASADADAIAACWTLLSGCGLTEDEITIAISHRGIVSDMTRSAGIADLDRFLVYLDGHAKRTPEQNEQVRSELGLDDASVERFWDLLRSTKDAFAAGTPPHEHLGIEVSRFDELRLLHQALRARGVPAAAIEVPKVEIVRGLAYYTGMVFEVTAAGERAVAGGGRYDGLVELFGGPPTPAVGFGMGDVVLSLLLEDQALLPEPRRLMELAGVRPDVFVISNGEPDSEARLEPALAALRAAGMHARRSHKSTRNVGKLLKEAGQLHARLAVILEDGSVATVRDLDARQQREGVMLGDLPGVCAAALGRAHAPRR